MFSVVVLIVHIPSAYTSSVGPESPSQLLLDGGDGGRGRGTEPGKLGAVASESAICSRYGTQMLEIGGNAADAVSVPPI